MSEAGRCYVCDNTVKNDMEDGFLQVTRYSGTPVCQFLEKFVGHVLVSRSQRDVWCPSCLDKIDCYDQAIVTAKQVETELLELFANTVNSYATADVSNSVVGLNIINISNAEKNEYNDNNDILFEEHLEEEAGISDSQDDEYVLPIAQLKKEKQTSKPKQQNRKKEASTDGRLQKQKLPVRHSIHSKTNVDKADVDSYKCERCNLKFEDKVYYKSHLKSHDATDKQVCDICGQTYKSKAALDIHVGLHKGVSPHECEMCGKKFTQRGALVRHMPIHTGERPYQVIYIY